MEQRVADETEDEFKTQDERRAHDRQRLIVDVHFDGEEVTGVASTKDISPGGLYMNTQAVIPEGAMLLVRIPFRHDNEIVCRAEVVYTEPGRGLGVRFRDLTDEARALLENEIGNG
jgi:PilZ domain-containing protein